MKYRPDDFHEMYKNNAVIHRNAVNQTLMKRRVFSGRCVMAVGLPV